MSNWKQKIEAQIADVRPQEYPHGKSLYYFTAEVREQLATSLEALLDVAVAAEEQQARLCTTPAWKWMQDNEYTIALGDAICKLREVGDGS